MYVVRPPAVAGAFYPGQAQALSETVARLLAGARVEGAGAATPTLQPKVLLVPHAGYTYSGPLAALAYAQLAAFREVIRRVVLLGPVHRVAVRGLALPGADAFATPLGEIAIDQNAVRALRFLPQVVVSPAAHALEHSLEVQLPFLQIVLRNFKLLPLAVGDAEASEVAGVLGALWGGPETLIVISSDLSHYLHYDAARQIDGSTVDHILALDATLTHEQACGGTPINGLLLESRRRHLRPRLLGQCNSGDVSGDRQRVVGYAAFSFTEPRHGNH